MRAASGELRLSIPTRCRQSAFCPSVSVPRTPSPSPWTQSETFSFGLLFRTAGSWRGSSGLR